MITIDNWEKKIRNYGNKIKLVINKIYQFLHNRQNSFLRRLILTIFTGFSIGDVVLGDVLVGCRGVCLAAEITRQAEQTGKHLGYNDHGYIQFTAITR